MNPPSHHGAFDYRVHRRQKVSFEMLANSIVSSGSPQLVEKGPVASLDSQLQHPKSKPSCNPNSPSHCPDIASNMASGDRISLAELNK